MLAGQSRAAQINAAILLASARATQAGERRTVYLQAGTYYLEAPIVLRSNVELKGVKGRTVLQPTWTTGSPDDATNAVIKIDGTLYPEIISTTLTTEFAKRSSEVIVTAIENLVSGYLLIQGWNDSDAGNDALLESCGTSVILSEVVKVSDTWNGVSTTIPLVWSTRQHHGPVSVTSVDPVVGAAVTDIEIKGALTAGNAAVGVHVRYSLDITLTNVVVSLMTRAAIECEGVKGFVSKGYRNAGTNNNWFHLLSVCDGDVSDFDGVEDTARVHPLGYPRYPFLMRSRCTNVVVHDGNLVNVAAGMYLCGGEHLTYRGINIRNVVTSQAVYDRMVLSGDLQDGGAIVLGWGSGFGPLSIAEFGFDVTLTDIRVEDIEAPSTGVWVNAPYRGRAFYLHDTLRMQCSNLSAINRGKESYCTGVVLSDVGAHISNLMVLGYSYGLVTENVATNVILDTFLWDGRRGDSPNDGIPFFFNHHGTNGHNLIINNMRHSSGFNGVRFGSSFLTEGAVDAGVTFNNMETDEGKWERSIVAFNNTGVSFSVGDIVEIDPTWTGVGLRVRTPDTGVANWQRRLAVVTNGAPSDYGTSNIMIALLPQFASVKATTAAVAYGDTIRYSGTRRCATDNTLDGTPVLGMAVSRKAAGAEGMILVAPIAG